ncbi:MAG: fused response regulator/phosphatase [Mycobacterium sp.]|jgi:serine phosphatase RsbU (regulator of sigma subunit)|uniref:PP2C family protein-serine/threonine phosphatase n=1 Tax=Mycobacterium sp. TaxID=1785 RepID=UPI00260B42A9|nr:SpoIIE family protein phosphatase [Mycobacterium sp.]MCW2664607.1 fused response regulator/phosphatase [Mycobacterium sp.]
MPVRSSVTPAAQWQSLSLLLVEDDRADAVLVEDLIADAVADIRVIWARSMAHAERELASARPDCVLLDLNLPDASGMDALDRIARRDATVPIVVLTGLNDEYFGASAVAAGAQDYLVKGRVEPEMLRRALLYAIERKRAELISADLHASRLRARENALLERGLLPSPLLLDEPGVDIVARYRPSREDALLCGDFYDVIQTTDRVVHVLIGDVAGHGPHEAALGAALRIAFRALTFAGVHGVELLQQLERVLQSERTGIGIFATVLSLQIHPDGTGITAIRAGHPGMLLQSGAGVEWIEPPAGPALGLRNDDWPQHELQLPAGQGLLLLTDGLFEGYSGQGARRLGEDGLLALARTHAHLPGLQFVDALIDGAQELAQPRGGLTDDIAVLRVERTTR